MAASGPSAPGPHLDPNYFVPIDIDRKISAYRLHASQVRGMRSPDPDERPSQISKSSTPQEIAVLLARAGFDAIEVEEEGTWVRGWAHKPVVSEPA